MRTGVSDRLWPVLTALAGLLLGAVLLETYAERRGNGQIVIAIGKGTLPIDDEDGAQEAPVRVEGPALSPAHQAARDAARRGDLGPAIAAFKAEVEARPDDAQLRFELGYWLLASGDAPAALAELSRAEQLRPDDPRLLLALGNARRKSGDLDGAERDFERALAAQPSNSARFALGTLLTKRGKYARAIEILRGATRTGGNSERARVLVALGLALIRADRVAEAPAVFDEAITWAPAQAELRLDIGRAYLTTGKKAEAQRAVEVLQKAAELAPDLPAIYSALGRGWEILDDGARAKVEYERALRLDPENRYVRIRLVRVALDRHEYAQARAMADRLIESGPTIPEHHFLAGLVAARSNRTDDARVHYREAIAQSKGEYPEAYFNLGLVERRAKSYDAAIAAYEQAIAQRPNYTAAINNLGLAYQAAGKTKEAEAAFVKATTEDPRYATGWLNLGQLFGELDRSPEAIAAFERAIAIKPDYAEARLDLGVAKARIGDLDGAIATYRALIEAEPRYVAAVYNLGLALEAQKHPDEAKVAYQKALELDPDHEKAMVKLAGIEERSGALGAARAIYQDLLEREPQDKEARIVLADLLRRDGDLEGCLREVDLALAQTPTEPRARELKTACERGADGRRGNDPGTAP